jgi:anti-sigma factor (TIGR02949 family)
MTCAELESRLHAYLDAELPEASARDVAAHVAQCPRCGPWYEEQRTLRAALRERLPALQAPPALRAEIRRALRAAGNAATADRPRMTRFSGWLAAAAVLAGVAAGSWSLARRSALNDAITSELLASHVRSLMPGHLTDVASTDQHTVKPWFNGRLDFSPPVVDFTAQGYPLIGGRMDYAAGRPVAVLVYGRRKHVINVTLWPATGGSTAGPAARTTQGYHLLHWTGRGFTYWVVSDLGMQELGEFAVLLRTADAGTP